MPYDLPDRLSSKIIPEPNSGCWIWIGTQDRDGYGIIRAGKSKRAVHRLVYEFYHGKLLNTVVIDHICKLTCCVNPDHLDPVSQRINILRGESPAAQNAKKTHCPKGHSLVDAYIITWNNSRACRVCSKARSNMRYQQLKKK